MPIETAIIPVAGLGTRLLPISAGVPKEMLPLGRKPALHYIAEELGRAGIRRIILVSSLAKQQVAKYFEHDLALADSLRATGKEDILATLWSQSPARDMQIDVAIQHQQFGLGHAILSAQKLAGNEPFVVALGDCVMGINGTSDIVERMIAVASETNSEIVIAFETVPDEKVSRYGIAIPASDFKGDDVFELAGLVEKPEPNDAPSNLAITARYILSPRIFKELENLPRGRNNEYQLTDAISNLIRDGVSARGVLLRPDEKRYDVGNINSYTEAFVEFAMADDELRQSVLKSVEKANR